MVKLMIVAFGAGCVFTFLTVCRTSLVDMFKRSGGDRFDDKRVCMFIVLMVEMAALHRAIPQGGFTTSTPDIGMGLVTLVCFSIVAFLAPYAAIKIFKDRFAGGK